jgi:ppGpp synthetase/RelA/SpoT-type nucleotidyltranferase
MGRTQAKNPVVIWNKLTADQRVDFLEPQEVVLADKRWSDLPDAVKRNFVSKIITHQDLEKYDLGGTVSQFSSPGLLKFAKGGEISNNYKGLSATVIWNRMSADQRLHFLTDHSDQLGGTYDESKIKQFTKVKLGGLPKNVAEAFREHVSHGQYAKGGQTPKVEILNEEETFDDQKYKGILDDFDLDGLPNVDDPSPLDANKAEGTVEQVEFSKTFEKLLNVKADLNDELHSFVNKLKKNAPANSVIYGRTKTPYSILNKLVDSRLLDEKRGLKDLVGTTIAFDDIRDLQKFSARVRKGLYGEVIDFDDYYSNPNDGYTAYHFIVVQNGVPIELQLKTKRMKDLNVLSHDAYKKKNLNKEFMLSLTTLADKADRGDKEAIAQYNALMSDKQALQSKLSNN